MPRLLLIAVISTIFSLHPVEAAKILAIFPTPSISHQVVFRSLIHELVRRGHEVVMVTTDPAYPNGSGPSNLTEIDLHDLSYGMWREQFLTLKKGNKEMNHIEDLVRITAKVFEKQLNSDKVQKLVQDKSKKFDLLFLEASVRPALIFSHLYKAPVIQVSSFGAIYGHYESMGAPTHPMLYPATIRQRIYNLTLWEKARELYFHYTLYSRYIEFEREENVMLRKYFGDDLPTLSELRNNVDMLFLNVNPLWEGNQPVPSSVVYMGGIHQNPPKELPQDLKSYLDLSKNGVIYVSFGTNVKPSLLPPEKIQIMVKVLSQLPYDILWKWDKDELPGQSKNIRISKWFPQADLLKHPKIKLFVTQAGLQSTDEAITAGVPLVAIPMVADQWYNAEKYVHHGMGIKLEMEAVNENSFMDAVIKVIEDDSFYRNVVRMRELMQDQPQSPLERAIWWTEYVLRHGSGRHLRSPAANISWTEYYEIELISIILLILFTLCTAFAASVYLLLNCIKKQLYSNKKMKKK